MAIEKKFARHIHYFRAFAILNIVAVHIWNIPSEFEGYPGVGFINGAREVVFHDSTIYFIFISGFLFYYLSPRINVSRYYKNKILNVISPYIIMSLIMILIKKSYAAYQHGDILTFIALTLLSGKALLHYWYIPFISIVFLASPLLLRIPENTLKKIAVWGLVLPLLGTRTDTTITIYQFVYFVPVYLLGIYVAMDFSHCMLLIKRNVGALTVILVLSTAILIFTTGHSYSFGVMKIKESVHYIQKVSICFLGLHLFLRFENVEIPLLDYFARYSFAIYFLHTMVGNNFIKYVYYNQVFRKTPELAVPLSIVFVVIISFATLLFSVFLKKILGSRSRSFIGA